LTHRKLDEEKLVEGPFVFKVLDMSFSSSALNFEHVIDNLNGVYIMQFVKQMRDWKVVGECVKRETATGTIAGSA
jgi:hypothetical protein